MTPPRVAAISGTWVGTVSGFTGVSTPLLSPTRWCGANAARYGVFVSSQTVLLTYNPAYWLWEERSRDVGQVGRWNVGRRSTGIDIGATAFVLQQGTRERGLIARGEVVSQIFSEPHFDGVSGHIAQCVEVLWHEIADSPVVSTGELEIAFPRVHWRPRQSGALVAPEFSDDLRGLWLEALG